MPDFIVTIPAADAQWQPDPDLPNYLPQPMPSTLMAEWTDGVAKQAYLYTEADISAWPVEAGVTGAWDSDTGLQNGQTYDGIGDVIGTPNFPVTADYGTFVRPLGNNAGEATGLLDSLRWQGHSEPKFLQDDLRYADSDAPFTLQIDRLDLGATAPEYNAGTTYQTGDYAYSVPGTVWQSSQDNNTGNPQFGGSPFWDFVNPSGWSWRVTMLSDDPLRDIAARAVSVHSGTPCNDGNFLYTTGAFHQDGGVGPFFTQPTGVGVLPNKEDVNFALRFGAGYEGWFVLFADRDDTDGLFWSADQP